MRLYLETADPERARLLSPWGAFAGVFTSPIVLGGRGLDPGQAAVALADAHRGDVLVQLEADDPDRLEGEARRIAELVPSRLMIQLPITHVGLEVISRLRDERIWTAAAPLTTLGQALLAAAAGADVLVFFYSAIQDSGADPEQEIREAIELCQRRGGRPRVLVAGLCAVTEILAVSRLGPWGAAVPPSCAEGLLRSAGTDALLSQFAEGTSRDRG